MLKSKPLIITIASIIFIVFFIWIIKKPLLSSYLSYKLKTNISMKSASISFSKMKLKNFSIKNPKNMKIKYAFLAESIDVDFSLKKLFSSPSIVNYILVDNIKLNIECKNPLCSRNNWTAIVNNISSKEKKEETKKEIIIKKINFRNLSVDIYDLGFDSSVKKTAFVKEIEFNNVNDKDGFPTKKLIAALFKGASLNDYLKSVIDLKNFLDNFNIFSIREEIEFQNIYLNEKGA